MGNLVSSDRSGAQRMFYDRPAGTWLEPWRPCPAQPGGRMLAVSPR